MFGVETPFLISLAISAIGAFGYVGFRRYRIKNKHKRIPFHVWLPIILNALTFSSTIAGSVVVLAGWGSINSGSQMSTEYSSIYETIVTYVFLAIVVMPFVNAFTLKESLGRKSRTSYNFLNGHLITNGLAEWRRK